MTKFISAIFFITTSCLFISEKNSKESKDYLYLLYENYYNFSEFQKAESVLKKLVSLYPEEKYIKEYIKFLYYVKKYKDVINVYKKYKDKLSLSKELLTYLMASALLSGDKNTYDNLKDYFLSLSPFQERDAVFLINMEILKGDKKGALELAKSMEKQFEESDEISRLKGRILIEMGNHSEGVKILENVKIRNDRDFLILSQAYTEMKDYDKALFYLLKTDSLRKNDMGVKRTLIDIFIEKRDFKKADSLTDILLKTDELNPGYLRLKGYLQYEMGNYAESIKNLLLAIEVNPNDDLSNYYISRIYYRLGIYDKSLEYLKKAMEINPQSVEYKSYKIFILVVKRDYRKAFYELRKAMSRYPDDPGINYLAGFLFSEMGRKQKAINFYLRSLEKDSLNHQKWFELGALYESLNMIEEAEECFKKVIELDSLNAKAYNYWGYMLAERGIKLELAVKLIERALEISPGNGFYLDSLGWVYYQMGDYRKAKEVLLQASQIQPEDPVILEHCGDVLMKLGEMKQAKEFYKKALKINPDNKSLQKKIEK